MARAVDPIDVVRDPERLKVVRGTALLDSPTEEAFDRLTRLAAKLTGAPVTFISLVDEGRDFYKSCFGFPDPLAQERQLTGTTFCHYALASDGPLIIEDTLASSTYREVPTVHTLGVRAYLGIPLVTNGVVIGSFCAIDFTPRAWTDLQVEVMRELAASTMREIELRAAVHAGDVERERLSVLLENVPAAVIFAEAPSGRVLLANRQVAKILGSIPTAESVEEYSRVVTLHPDGRPVSADERALARAVRGHIVQGEDYDVVRADGRPVSIRVHGAPVRDPAGESIIGGVIAFYDVTEERAILRENQRLYEEARSANKAQDDFFATVSHELRTPMTAILGWSKLLAAEQLENVTAAEAAEAIASSARLQAQLIDDLLDASRIATGKIALACEALDVNEAIRGAVRAAEPVAASSGVRLRTLFGGVRTIEGDPARLRQVVGNLLSNAIKFTPRGGLVEITSAMDGEFVTITVADTGRGIEPELLTQIFEKHRQARSAELGGLGLGLTIVRHLVQLHGGEIRAESDGAGRGARFIVKVLGNRRDDAARLESPAQSR